MVEINRMKQSRYLNDSGLRYVKGWVTRAFAQTVDAEIEKHRPYVEELLKELSAKAPIEEK